MSAGYPIVLDLSNRLIVIIGGGAVALRKVRGLLDSGATRIRIVSPQFHPEMPSPSAALEQINSAYVPQHLEGASLVFAATDSAEVNSAVVSDARKINALVCRADVDEENAGDFATPAMLRQGSLLVTVSSGGSPALSAMIRDKIKETIDPRWLRMADAMVAIRPMLRGALSPARRKLAFHELTSEPALQELDHQGIDGLMRWLIAQFPELKETTH